MDDKIIITEIWFDTDHIYGKDKEGKVYKQSLLWYPHLLDASDDERNNFTFGYDGIHWRNLDEDISFESFGYEDAEPSAFQKFFLTHKEINIDELAYTIGITPTLLYDYIHGFNQPTKEQEKEIQSALHKLGNELASVRIAS